MIEIELAYTTVSKSKNLRGILEYARNKSSVSHATCYRQSDGGAFVYVLFDNGATCRTRFADYTVALRWFRSRRSWDLSECYCSPNMTSFRKG